VAVPIPGRARRAFVAAPLQRRRDLVLQQPFDEPPDLLANTGFERIEPSLFHHPPGTTQQRLRHELAKAMAAVN
jgi:hypothetical protein